MTLESMRGPIALRTGMVTLLAPDLRIRQIIGVLINLSVRSIKRDRLKHVLRQLELLGINRIIPLVQKEIVILPLFLLLFTERLEVFLAFFHSH